MSNHRLFYAFLLLGFFVFGCGGSSEGNQGAKPGKNPVSLMSFNLRYASAEDQTNSWNFRRKQVFDTIRKYGGDFIGLQEVIESQLKELGEELSGYKCIGEARHDRSYANPLYNEWNPICYKTALWKVDPVENGTFWLSETPDVLASKSWGSSLPRICTWAKFTHRKTGKSLYIYNTHYDQVSQEARINSSKLILKRMSQRKSKESPVFLMGDLNAGENSDSVQLLTSTPIDKNKNDLLLDTFRHLYPNAGKTGTYNYWIGFKLGPKVDYIFGLSSQKSRIISAKILHHHTGGHYPSDHFPVIASINFD